MFVSPMDAMNRHLYKKTMVSATVRTGNSLLEVGDFASAIQMHMKLGVCVQTIVKYLPLRTSRGGCISEHDRF